MHCTDTALSAAVGSASAVGGSASAVSTASVGGSAADDVAPSSHIMNAEDGECYSMQYGYVFKDSAVIQALLFCCCYCC